MVDWHEITVSSLLNDERGCDGLLVSELTMHEHVVGFKGLTVSSDLLI